MPDEESGLLKELLGPTHRYGFSVYTRLRIENELIIHDDIRTVLRESVVHYVGFTYVWIGVNDQQRDCWRALYVGSTRTIVSRQQSHTDNLNNKDLALKNEMANQKSSEIKNIISNLGRVDIYARPSGTMCHLDEEIPSYYADELAFIEKLKPCWNIDNNRYNRSLTWYSE